MPLFRITKKLATALHVKLPTTPVVHGSADHEWFADLFFVHGKKCVVWVHRPTLFVFVRPSVIAAELRQFHALFRYEFRTAMASMSLPESLIEQFDVHGPELYAPTNDRAVVGSMLDYRKMFEVMIEVAPADVRGINAQLNESPMSVLGMESAIDVVRKLVGHAARTLH